MPAQDGWLGDFRKGSGFKNCQDDSRSSCHHQEEGHDFPDTTEKDTTEKIAKKQE